MMPEDVAVALSKSDIDPCRYDRDIDRQQNADGRMDGEMAFQLYIRSRRYTAVYHSTLRSII